MFLFVTWPGWPSVTWLCEWSPLILSLHPAKFGVHRPNGTGNNGVCNICSNSNCNSNSNTEVPMLRFANGQKGCSYNFYIARNKELHLIWQKLYSGERQMPCSPCRKSTEMNHNWPGKLQATLLSADIS